MSPAIQGMQAVPLAGVTLPTDVRMELEAILESEEFRSSQRCQTFLRYIVEAIYAGSADSLKERTIGIVLFGRTPNYDTGADAIVRVTALETRRRLARYEHVAPATRPVVITLTPGTYIPSIAHRDVKPPQAAEPETSLDAPLPVPAPATIEAAIPHTRSRSLAAAFVVGAFCILLLAALGVWSLTRTQTSLVETFWKPTLTSKKTILCTSKPNAYIARPAAVATGDANLALSIQDMMAGIRHPTRMAIASDLSESDLREAPTILIGSSGTNLWTAKMTNSFRFQYAIVGGKPVILDRSDPSRFWEAPERPDVTHDSLDYAVVTRLLHSQYGPGVISIAGASSLSTHAAGEELMHRDTLATLLRNAPDNWPHKNLQLVIRYQHTQSVDSEPQVVAAVYW